MKKIIKIAFAIAISFAFLSCGLFNDEIPSMSSRVVSYKKPMLEYKKYEENEELYISILESLHSRIGFITDEDILKWAFPHIFDKEQANCNYFAIYFSGASASNDYWILSRDMVLYRVKASNYSGCEGTTDIIISAMLICDDTAEGNLKDKINLNSTHSLTDSDWDCKKSEYDKGVFF
ncbi:MAG: hypothetical protein LBC87_09080 [Fibromonadaceae bacterium]|jgi:hypothetical protein|nr:hypothetical protein [Fibromonadaceae bacterium]